MVYKDKIIIVYVTFVFNVVKLVQWLKKYT